MAEGEGLQPGIERSDEFTVEDRLLTSVGGTIGVGTHERRIVKFDQLG